MCSKFIIAAAFAACVSLQSHAQGLAITDSTEEAEPTPPADSVKKPNELRTVEVRAIRASPQSPFAKTNLTQADIAPQNLAQDVPILLQLTPSAVVTSDAGNGIGYTGIRIRGTDPTRINVTFNGIPVNDPEEQNTFYVNFPDLASSTGSIQIQRGVGTSTNGAGAFGGTISINNLTQLDTAGVLLSTSAGSFGTLKATLMAGTGRLKGGWQFDVRLSKINSNGYMQRSAADLRSLQLTAGWQPNARTAVRFLFMPGTETTGQAWNGVPQDSLATNRRYNELGARGDGTYYNRQTDNYTQQYYQLFADHQYTNDLTGHVGLFMTRGKGYYEEYKLAQPYGAYYLPPVTSSAGDTLFSETDLTRRLFLDNYYYGGVFSLLYSRKATQLTLGGGFTQFTNLGYGNVLWAQNGGVPEGYKWYQFDGQKNDLNIYAKAEHRIGQWLLFGDMQYRTIAWMMNGYQNYPDLRNTVNYHFYNPKAGLSWLLRDSWTNRQRAYASVAVANREPARSAFQADPANLPRPERLIDVEGGYEVNRRQWSAAANLYYMSYYDQLVLTGQINQVGAYVQTNVNSSYRAGIELQGACAPAKWLRIMGNLTLSQNKIADFTEYIDNYDSTAQRVVKHGTTDIAFAPNLVSGASVAVTPYTTQRGNAATVEVQNKYVGAQYLDNTSNTNRQLAAYTYTNLLLRYTCSPKPFREVSASFMLYNVFGALYSANGYTFSYIADGRLTTQNYYFPQAPLHFMAGLTVRW